MKQPETTSCIFFQGVKYIREREWELCVEKTAQEKTQEWIIIIPKATVTARMKTAGKRFFRYCKNFRILIVLPFFLLTICTTLATLATWTKTRWYRGDFNYFTNSPRIVSAIETHRYVKTTIRVKKKTISQFGNTRLHAFLPFDS